MREQLIRYLLGELNCQEHDRLRADLERSPELRAELARLRACLAAHQQDEIPTEPPGGLTARVIQQVAHGDSDFDSSELRRADILSRIAEPPPGMLGWSLADLTVAGGVIMAVSMLLFPALRSSRDGTRLSLCQKNLVELYVLQTGYADGHNNKLPQGEANEPAGTYVAELVDAGVREEVLRLLLMCPDAPAPEQIREKQKLLGIKRLRGMAPAEASSVARWMSPCYAIRVGYYDGETYHPAKLVRNRNYALISDSPGEERDGHMSPNHGGYIVQVVFGDGSVRSLTNSVVPGTDDELFSNDAGLVAAGCGPQDCVLSPSGVRPGSHAGLLGSSKHISGGR